jgi:hypothetical protein
MLEATVGDQALSMTSEIKEVVDPVGLLELQKL